MCAACSTGNGNWVPFSVAINSILTPTPGMRLRLVIRDAGPDHILEGGFDHFQITGTLPSGLNEEHPSPLTWLFFRTRHSDRSVYDTASRRIM
jgi:hypothetical protein